ncbi:uncharacterized protein [Haliotis cracherodii]
MVGRDVWIVLLISLLPCSGWEYCSDTKHPAPCTRCRNDGTDVYKCPRQCGGLRNINLCDQVCSNKCKDSECEFEDGKVSLRCVKGCDSLYTGSACERYCQERCATCDQSGRCTKCTERRYGGDCEKTCNNCGDGTCAQEDGKCTSGCKPGYHGPKCDKRCDTCKQCDQDMDGCISCDQNSGRCLLGCTYGFYGHNCTLKCPGKCIRCNRENGSCVQCETGLQGVNCSTQLLPPPEKPKQQHGDEPTEEVTTKSGLLSMFQDEDYLLPVIGCGLVLLAIVAVVIIWRCKKRSKKKAPGNEEEGNCESAPQHPSVRRLINSSGSGPHYDEINTDDVDGLKKHLLGDRELPRIPTPANKPLACLRNRSGNLSVPYMTPIVEAVEEEEEEEEAEEDESETIRKVLFTLEAPSDEETAGDCASLPSNDPGSSVDGPEFTNTNGRLAFENETRDGAAGAPEKDVDHLNVPGRGIYIFHNGSNVGNGGYGDYADSCYSGLSTPKVPDMYLESPHDDNKEFASNIADHLDTYLSQRQNLETDPELVPAVQKGTSETGASESDVLVGPNTEEQNMNNNNEKRGFKSKLPLPKWKAKYNHTSFVPKCDMRVNTSENSSMLNRRDTVDC